nr:MULTISPECIES: contact-dependent growth inhibition system immunity protein [unclassified Variovorax]
MSECSGEGIKNESPFASRRLQRSQGHANRGSGDGEQHRQRRKQNDFRNARRVRRRGIGEPAGGRPAPRTDRGCTQRAWLKLSNELDRKKARKNVSAFKNSELLYLWPMTGLRLLFIDPRVSAQLLSLNDDTETIGSALVQALTKSTILTSEEFQEIFRSGEIQKKGDEWDNLLIERFSYKSSKFLYKGMSKCSIREANGNITISPSLHNEIQSWTGISGVDDVILPAHSSNKEIGLALLEGFNRCEEA